MTCLPPLPHRHYKYAEIFGSTNRIKLMELCWLAIYAFSQFAENNTQFPIKRQFVHSPDHRFLLYAICPCASIDRLTLSPEFIDTIRNIRPTDHSTIRSDVWSFAVVVFTRFRRAR